MLSKNAAKYIQSLQHKKFRDQYGVFVAEGRKLVGELLQQGVFKCRAVYATEKAVAEGSFFANAPNIETIQEFELQKISSLSTPNQVLAIFEKSQENKTPDLAQKISLALDDIQDPGNLGTIIRNADWFGIEHIICSLHTADMYNPKVVQSTMASIGRVNIMYTDLEGFLKTAAQQKYAAVLNGAFVHEIKKPSEAIIIIGNESKGICPEILALQPQKITIKQFGGAESLNAGVASAVILQEFLLH
ncbi:MAG: RNA methyltransferase [Ferruginibacter sp.]